jgi:hypothetical protein
MLKPKKTGARRVLQNRGNTPIRYCQNPNCGAKIANKDNEKYCDRVCSREHASILKLERRPKEVNCAACGKSLDPLSREPYQWNSSDTHFCDEICATAWRKESGKYQEMSQKGNEAIRAYKKKHGHMHNYAQRSQRISEHNQTHPPKSKLYVRVGNVWGYEAHVLPNNAKDGYIAHIPELTELVGSVEAKTSKDALKALRARFLEIRMQENQNQEDGK